MFLVFYLLVSGRVLFFNLPFALSSSIAFPSLLRFAEGVSPVGHRTALGRLELLVGVVH